MNTLGEIAANLGLPTFPCRADKTPLTLNGFKTASCDPPTIRRMFGHPDAALIGVPTGEASGQVAIDVDIHHANADGHTWLTKHKHELPSTRTHKTRSGGLHLIFQTPHVEIRNSAGRIAPGVDVRGQGGYIIFPPSPGYVVADKTPPAEMPAWLVQACLKPDPIPPPPPRKTQSRLDGGTSYGLAALTDECDAIRSAPFGQQEKTLNRAGLKVGGLVAGGEIEDSVALAELIAAGCDMPSESGRDPWRHNHIELKVRRAMQDGHPRGAPEPEPEETDKRRSFGIGKPNGHTAPTNGEDLASPQADDLADGHPVDTEQNDGGSEAPADARPVIRVRDGTEHRMATEAEAAVLQSGIAVFRRGFKWVRPTIDTVPAANGRKTAVVGLKDVTPAGMLDLLLQAAQWRKFNARKKDWVPTKPPSEVGAIILSRYGEWTLPQIAGVITTPTLRPNGTVLSEPGYDPETRLFYVVDPNLTMPTMPDRPTMADAEVARNDLLALLKNFPFVGDASRSVALSGLITPIVRAAMPVAPLHAYRAPTAGTGKSYLVDLASVIATGQICPVTSAGVQPEEFDKKLTGLLLAGYPVVSIDNVNGELGGDLLCQAVERPMVRLRRLGASDQQEVECKSTMFATGNGLVVKADLTRRTIRALLDANVEKPEMRVFDFDPVQTVLANRGRYVAACLVVVRAYQAAGMPGKLPQLASYGQWSDLVRSALVWLGQADPCDSMDGLRTEDPSAIELQELLELWDCKFPDRGATAKEAIQLAEKRRLDHMAIEREHLEPDLRELLLRISGSRGSSTMNSRLLGEWISGKAGRIEGGMKFVRAGLEHKVAKWKVVKV